MEDVSAGERTKSGADAILWTGMAGGETGAMSVDAEWSGSARELSDELQRTGTSSIAESAGGAVATVELGEVERGLYVEKGKMDSSNVT